MGHSSCTDFEIHALNLIFLEVLYIGHDKFINRSQFFERKKKMNSEGECEGIDALKKNLVKSNLSNIELRCMD